MDQLDTNTKFVEMKLLLLCVCLLFKFKVLDCRLLQVIGEKINSIQKSMIRDI